MERQSPLLKRTVEKKNAPQNQKTQCVNVNLSRAPRLKENVLDKPARWVFFRGHSWWGSFFLCNDSPPVKHKPRMLEWQQMANQSCKNNPDETHLIKVQSHYNVWLYCELMHCLQEVHMTNVWQDSSQGGQSTPPVVITETTHMGRNACIFFFIVKKTEVLLKDTKEVKGSCHIDDSVSRLGLLAWGKLDDLLWSLQELRNPRPGTVSLLAMWPP